MYIERKHAKQFSSHPANPNCDLSICPYLKWQNRVTPHAPWQSTTNLLVSDICSTVKLDNK